MLGEIEALLKRTIGLEAATVGSSAIARAVRARQASRGLGDIASYSAHLRESPEELQELVEAVIVPETWFFRDRGAFEAVAQLVRERLPELLAGRRLRLLSLPCSTGEEPYSIAMTLLDAGLTPERFAIDAMDVSGRSIAIAERAIYGRNAFRSGDLGFRDRHFAPVQGGFRPGEAVRQSVRFIQGNLFHAATPPGSGGYDIVFCRNLLIYFDRPMQEQAIGVLHRLLLPDGHLFLGPSETALPERRQFTWAKLPMAFAFRKATAALVPATPMPRVETSQRPPPERTIPQPPAPPPATQPEPELAGARLKEAQRLANGGQLAEAARQCEAVIRQHGPSAEAFHLLGLVKDAAGDRPAAVANYRKALYLDPHHQETLAHLALQLDYVGDDAGARMLRGRLQRSALRGAG
ncbi:CheR family methyltransferase [Pseudoroseomonas globiformis]|uniref:CheR family methyltransferase n=1 Tax=Teichococcus globiformis TaxID=2307229 RepID=A0ABV7G7F9_9PROT